jgi:hypothetical protein
MLTPSEIKGMAERKYPTYLQSLVTGENLFPMRLRFGVPSTSDSFAKLQADVAELEAGNFGYTIERELKNTRKHGAQTLPTQVRFDTAEQFIEALGKGREERLFLTNITATLNRLPKLRDWLVSHVKWVVEFGHVWDGILLVAEYFRDNPRPELYIRQLPIAVHTKFIQENRQLLSSLLSFVVPPETIAVGNFEERFGLKPLESMIRFRVLDPTLMSTLGITHQEMGLPLEAFCSLPIKGLQVIITENLMNFECLPPTQNCMAIFGQGNAAELLHEVPWLNSCDVRYWGDIDEHGFHILARLRSTFPSIHSMMMGIATLERFRELAGPGEPAGKAPINLTEEERQAFDVVKREGLRLEQEKIPAGRLQEL